MAVSLKRSLAFAFSAGAIAGMVLVLLLRGAVPGAAASAEGGGGQQVGEAAFTALKDSFRRPKTIPFPANNSFSKEKRALGQALFNDRRLSADNSLSCASCHNPTRGFSDGRRRAIGVPGHRLARHTPGLWNLAFAADVFWDGRARSLEEQVVGPIEAPDEMALPMDQLVARLRRDPATVRAFAAAFPATPDISATTIAQALATYERALISPLTRFDRWIEGDDTALTAREVEGFRVFTGKAGCASCHSGFAFTDYAFHDNGLPGEDRGRGAILRLNVAEHAFKTPGLRELRDAAPYMHDGSLATLTDVVRHYESGVIVRPSTSPDQPRKLSLSRGERAALLAFLDTLSAPKGKAVPAAIVPGLSPPIPPAARVTTISQYDKSFSPTHVALAPGERLWFLNNDTRTHNVRVFDPALNFDSGAQEPGETVEIAFSSKGSFLVFCGIHPKMQVVVDVE